MYNITYVLYYIYYILLQFVEITSDNDDDDEYDTSSANDSELKMVLVVNDGNYHNSNLSNFRLFA